PDVSEVLLRRVARGIPGETRIVARTSGARQSGFPRLVVRGTEVIAAWTSVQPVLQVHVARISLSPTPTPTP
ncbi:MAG: hypothetical protein ACK54K_04335, partial [Gemmatimonadaceae bacterium]